MFGLIGYWDEMWTDALFSRAPDVTGGLKEGASEVKSDAYHRKGAYVAGSDGEAAQRAAMIWDARNRLDLHI